MAKTFNLGGIIFGQVADSFISIAGNVAANTIFRDSTANKTQAIAESLIARGVDPDKAADKANYLTQRVYALGGPIANIAGQAVTAAREHGSEGAVKSVKNSIVARAVSLGVVNTAGYALTDSVIKPITETLGKVLQKLFRNLAPDQVDGISMGIVSELVTTVVSLPITFLANGWRPGGGGRE